MKISEMNWRQVEAYLAKDDRAVLPARQHRAACATEPLRRLHPVRAGRGRGGAEPLGVPVFPAVAYGVTPYFLAFPGTVTLRVETYHRGRQRHPGQPRAPRLPAHPDRQRPWRQRSRRSRWRIEWMADHPDVAGEVPQLVERAQDLGQGAGDRSRSPRTPPGWRTSPGRAWPASPAPTPASSRWKSNASDAADVAQCRSQPISATAISAATTSGRTRRCMALWEVAVEETRALLEGRMGCRARTDPDLGRRRDRRHARRAI